MRHSVKISDLMKEFNLPENAVFAGIVVHLPESDEFLGHYVGTSDFGGYVWVKIPDLAYIFESQEKAEQFVSEYQNGAVVGLLFDLGDKYSLNVLD